MEHNLGGYGAVKDPVDHRDFLYAASGAPATLPAKVDLRGMCPMVHEQGSKLGTCTAHAIAGAFQFEQRRLKLPDFSPSRLFIYYNERAFQHARHEHGGANLRAGLKAVKLHGVCPEKLWPYVEELSVVRTRPPESAYDVAKHHKVLAYHRIQMGSHSHDAFLKSLKSCLAEGCPFMFAFLVHESFEADPDLKSGVMPMPEPREKIITWHAVMAVGYDDHRNHMLVRNSWGWSWGHRGYFWMPYDYILNPEVTADFWTIRGVTPETERS